MQPCSTCNHDRHASTPRMLKRTGWQDVRMCTMFLMQASYHAAHHSQTTTATGARSSVDYSQRGSSVQGIRATQGHPTHTDCAMSGHSCLPRHSCDTPTTSTMPGPRLMFDTSHVRQAVTTDSLGLVALKGIVEHVEIFRCQM